jgi:hypothetical protein
MNVRDPKIDELAQKLAAQTGEEPAQAVIRALEERLERNAGKRQTAEDSTVAHLLAIAERATGLQAEGKTSRELIDELYDENGLPA